MRPTNLDLDALRSFAVGFETGSFARAAERLGRSTSAVSAQLKKLEEQAGVSLLRKSGRGLRLTDAGETLLSYAQRLLDLNDEALGAVGGANLEGWIRLGLQEDFGETILPGVLGQFARAHPKVRIEGRIARNGELVDKIASRQLDIALAWDGGERPARVERIASVPLCWLAAANDAWRNDRGEPLPLALLETPCLLRDIACEQLDRQGTAWRVAFVSPSLAGLWAATAAGLGLALRTPIGHPKSVRMLDPAEDGLPTLPSIDLVLHRVDGVSNVATDHLVGILKQALRQALPGDWYATPPQH